MRRIYNSYQLIRYLALFLGLLAAGFVFWLMSKKEMISTMWLFIFIIWLMVIILIINKKYHFKKINQLLFDDLNITAYETFFETAAKKGILDRKTNAQQLLIAKSTTEFYRGHFQSSLDYLSKIKIRELPHSDKRRIKRYIWYMTEINKITLGYYSDSEKVDFNIKNTIKFLPELTAINDILNNRANDFFDKKENCSRLESLVAIYYQGKNAMIENRKTTAKRLFESISTENPELFYVQKANDYLGELSHDKP